MRAAEVAFVGALIHRFPTLAPILQEHLDDYDGLLPHVLMADITRWVVEHFRTVGQEGLLREVLGFIEASFEAAQEHERELIIASFLENLPRAGEEGAALRDRLGPALRQHLELIG